jgi:hypothetical protein
VGYLLVRPALARAVPHLGIWEFPAGAALAFALVALSLRRRERRAPPEPWRKHRQVVRALPDPEAERLAAALERWARAGGDPAPALDVLARATGRPAASLSPLLRDASTERKRRALLRKLTTGA